MNRDGEPSKVKFWWHSFPELGIDGETEYSTQQLRLSFVPDDLKGKTVLDVGCWDGWYSFKCEEKGADVIAIDNLQMEDFVESKFGIEDYDGSKGFKTVKEVLDSDVRYLNTDVDNLDLKADIVLFFGVLYHLKDPLHSLENLRMITKEKLFLETRCIQSEKPVMLFTPWDSKNEDPTIYWLPSVKAVLKMLEEAGFEKSEILETYGNRVMIEAE